MTQDVTGDVSRPKGSKVRSVAAKLLLLTITLLIGLALMEWAVRRVFPYFSPTAQVPFRLATNRLQFGAPV